MVGERLASLALGAEGPVKPYDQDELATARGYDGIPLQAALWSLQRALGDWSEAVALAERHGGVVQHPERGSMTVLDVMHAVAHDAYHHAYDIRRTVSTPSP